MPVQSPQQISLGGGVNAVVTPHLISDGEVATATNIDFSMQPGAAQVRFGSRKLYSVGANLVRHIYIHYKTPIENSVTYVEANGSVYRQIGSSFTSIMTSANNYRTGFTQFGDYVYTIGAAGSNSIKDNGTNVTHWIKENPSAPIVSVITTNTGITVTSTYDVSEGTLASQASGTATFTEGTAPYRIQIDASAITTNLDQYVSAGDVGVYGTHAVLISFSNPGVVTRISQDYSIGDTSFKNYWHTDLDLNFGSNIMPDVVKLIDTELTLGTATTTGLDADTRNNIISLLKSNISSNTTRMSFAADSFNTWTVARPNFELVSVGTGQWSDIKAARIIVEAESPVEVKVCDWKIYGDKFHSLNDTDIGYMWWHTFAKIDDGLLVSESAASDPVGPTKASNGDAVLLLSTATSTTQDITHSIIYRSGGLLPQPYAIATISASVGTHTDTLSDLKALINNEPLQIGGIRRNAFYASIEALSEPHYGRIFAATENNIVWSDPGVPDRFSKDNYLQVSHTGDEVGSLVVWPPGLVIVNRDSVYELDGNIFEGPEANYILRRTGARRGSKASRTVVKTPYGIPLLDMDGLYMYAPGQGVELPLDFVHQQIGDAWKGSGPFDPVSVKGNRVPAIQIGYIDRSCAEYYDNKYYLAVPTGTDTYAKTLFVIDFATKRTWWYTYPFEISSLCWDIPNGRLLAGTTGGSIIRLHQGYYDENDSASTVNIPWKIRTRTWTTPNDTVLENIMLEAEGVGGNMYGIYDGTTTTSLSTLTNTIKDWVIPALSGQVKNNVAFEFSGTQGSNNPTILQGLRFDALEEPARVTFWRTEHDTSGHGGDGIWDVHYADIEPIGTGTITGIVYLDNVVVSTHLITSTSTQANRTLRRVDVQGLPAETVGRIAYTEYIAGTGMQFKHWNTYYNKRPLPDLVTSYVSDKHCGDEAEWKTFEPCLGLGTGTVLATSFLDGTAIQTHTLYGGSPYRQSYARSITNDMFGRTMYTVYNAANTAVPFRFFEERYENIPEPDVVTNWKHGPIPFSSRNSLKTWVVTANPRGSMVGVVYADNTPISTATFTGSDKSIFTIGLDVNASMTLQTATILEAYYTGAGFKHWNTEYETEQRPFGKSTWSIVYKKVGGATQIDLARFWSFDVEAQGIGTFTSIWDVDGTATHTQTFTVSGREFRDRIAFPAGVRGQLFQQRILSTGNIHVHRVNIDMERVGVKGFTRNTYVGTPQE
jgi:hypothetical protein